MTARGAQVRDVAARLPGALKRGDGAGVGQLLATLDRSRDLTALVLLLAQCADRRKLNAATGWAHATPAEFHARFVWLRARGVGPADMDPRVVAGESAYQAAQSPPVSTRSRAFRGHAPVQHSPGHWRCKCGTPLPGAASWPAARRVMADHRAALSRGELWPSTGTARREAA